MHKDLESSLVFNKNLRQKIPSSSGARVR